MEFEIRSLSPGLLEDFLYFFDNVAFADNHDWAGCYCYYNQFPGTPEEWVRLSGEQNRASVIELINSGEMKGYLAYSGGKAVGWCNANDKRKFPHLATLDDSPERSALKCYAISCFLIAKDYRRKGLSRLLLKRVCEDCCRLGYDCVEVYPRMNVHTCAENYHGYPEMYEQEGFVVVKDLGTAKVMRKPLAEYRPDNEDCQQ